MNNTFKPDLENFEYDKRYPTLIEHRWCFLRSNHNVEVFYNRKDKMTEPVLSRVQSDPDYIGQYEYFK